MGKVAMDDIQVSGIRMSGVDVGYIIMG